MRHSGDPARYQGQPTALRYFDHAREDITWDGKTPALAELVHAIGAGTVNRPRPKLMTVAAIMPGLLSALWSQGTGAEVRGASRHQWSAGW